MPYYDNFKSIQEHQKLGDRVESYLKSVGQDEFSRKTRAYQDSAKQLGNYLSGGQYTSADNQKYRQQATQAITDLDNQLKTYKKNSDEYKQLDSYRNYYQNALNTFDRTDVGVNAMDYINADGWHDEATYKAQHDALQSSIDAIQSEMDMMEDQTSADYQNLAGYRDWYQSLMDGTENAPGLTQREKSDRMFKSADDYVTFQRSFDYKNSIETKKNLEAKKAELKELEDSGALTPQVVGDLSTVDPAAMARSVQLQNEIAQMQDDLGKLEQYQAQQVLSNYNFGIFDGKTDYGKVVDDLKDALRMAKTDEDKAKIEMQLRTIAGENYDGTKENGVFDEGTLYGQWQMSKFDTEKAQKELDEINKELKDMGLAEDRWASKLQAYTEGFLSARDFAGVTSDNPLGEYDLTGTELDPHVAELRRRKNELTQQMQLSQRLQDRLDITEKIPQVEGYSALVEEGKKHLREGGSAYYAKGYDAKQGAENSDFSGVKLLKNFDALTGELSEDDAMMLEQLGMTGLRDSILAAIGAEYTGQDIGYSVQDILNAYEGQMAQFAGYKAAKDISNMNSDFARWNRQVFGVGTQAGLNQFATGIQQFFSDDYIAPNKTAAKAQYTRQDLERYGDEKLFKNSEQGGSNVSQLMFDTVQTTANMLPMIAASYLLSAAGAPEVAAGVAGATLMGVSSAGNTYQQALAEGWDKDDARVFSLITGTAEGALQYAIGGISALGGMSDDALLAAARGINNAGVRFATETGIHIASETMEELAQNRLQRLLEYTMFDKGDGDWMSWNDDDWYTVMVTALSTGALEGRHSYQNTIGAAKTGSALSGKTIPSKGLTKSQKARSETLEAIGARMKSSEAVEYTLVELGTQMDEGSTSYEIATAIKDGKIPANAMNLGNLYDAYLNDNAQGKRGQERSKAYDDAMLAVVGGAIKYNEIQKLEGEQKQAELTHAEIVKANPGAEVLDKVATEMTELGLPGAQAAKISPLVNKVLSGEDLSEAEMTELTGDSFAAQAARSVLSQRNENIKVEMDPAMAKEAITALTSDVREIKKQQTALTQQEVVQAAMDAVADFNVKQAAAGATSTRSVMTNDGVAQNRVSDETAAKLQESQTAVDEAQAKLDAVKKMSFREIANLAGSNLAVSLGEDTAVALGEEATVELGALTHEMGVLEAKVEGMRGNKMPSKAQSTELAKAQARLAELKQQVVGLYEKNVSEAQARAEEAKKAQAEAAQPAAAQAGGNTVIPAKQQGAPADVILNPDGGVQMTRQQFVQQQMANGVSEEEANKNFDEASAQSVALYGGKYNGQQSTDQDGQGTDLGGRRDGVDGSEGRAEPERAGEPRVEERRAELRTRGNALAGYVSENASVTEGDRTELLDKRFPDLQQLTEELTDRGFKRVVYISNGHLYNEAGQAVPAIYNNGEVFLDLSYSNYRDTAAHETGHLMLDLLRGRLGETEAARFVSGALQNLMSRDEYVKKFGDYLDLYSVYSQRNLPVDEVARMINEEILCDMLGGINGMGSYREEAWEYLEDSHFSVVTQNIADGYSNPGELIVADEVADNAMPHDVPVDTLISDRKVDEPSTAPADPANTSRMAFFGLASALGFKVDETHPKSKVYYLSDEDAKLGRNGFTQITVDMVKQSPIGRMIQYAQEQGYITEDQADQEYNMFASIGSISNQTHDFFQAMQFMGSTIFTALKMNSDPQYGTTYDFPSICTKTQAVIDDMSEQMKQLKRALKEDEILEIYQRQFTAGNPVPCPECYVFSRWVGIGGLLDNINYYQNTYGGMTVEEVEAVYKENEAKVRKAAEEAGVNFGKQKSKMASELQKQYNKLKTDREKAEETGKSVPKKKLEQEAALRRQMSDIRGLSWIDNVYFGGKAHTAANVNPNYFVPTDILFDLNAGEEFASRYKEAWAFRTTQGAGYGKAITPYAEAILGEGIQVTKNNNAIKQKADGSLDHIFLTEKGPITEKDQRGKALKAATQKQLNQLFIGGQRFQSTSDARFDNAVDYLLAGLEMQTMRGGVQVYTKVPGAVHFFNILGMCTNMSLMPKGSGLDANGNPVDTTTGGMNPETAMMLRLGNENAGTITIGVNDAHIRAMFNQAFRDFIIPYHASGGKADLIAEFRRIQEGRAKGEGTMPQSTDYTNTQADKFLSDEILLNDMGYTAEEIEDVHKFRESRLYLLTGKGTFHRELLNTSEDGLTESQINARKILQELYLAIQDGGKWNGVALAKNLVAKQIFPNEFWDTSANYENSGVNTQRYLDYCKALGVLHRFSGKGVKTGKVTNLDGSVVQRGHIYTVTGHDQHGNEVPLTDLAYKENGEIEPFFWKVLTDRRMYGNQGQYLEQPRVDLTNLKAGDVVTFAAPMGERRYDRKTALRVAAQPLTSSSRYNAQQDTAAVDPVEEAQQGGTFSRYSIRQEPPPKKTQWGFKLMNVDENGLPHAMFIDAAAPYEYGVWYDADSPQMANLLKLEPGYAYLVDANDVADESSRRPVQKVKGSFRGLPGKTDVNQATAEGKRWMVVDQYADGSKSIHNVGINGSGGTSTFALRPGIHAVDIPSMSHIGARSEGSKKIDTRRPNQRWFLIEYPVDNDYNQEAYSHETKDIREHLPENGWYSFQTNSGAEARQHWFITGGMKVVGPVAEADARKFARDRGFEEDLPWKQGKSYSEDDAINLDEYIRTTQAMPTPSKDEMRQRIEAERGQKKPVIPSKGGLTRQQDLRYNESRFSRQGSADNGRTENAAGTEPVVHRLSQFLQKNDWARSYLEAARKGSVGVRARDLWRTTERLQREVINGVAGFFANHPYIDGKDVNELFDYGVPDFIDFFFEQASKDPDTLWQWMQTSLQGSPEELVDIFDRAFKSSKAPTKYRAGFVPTALDKEYLNAIKKNDTAALARMVAERAAEKGYNKELFQHAKVWFPIFSRGELGFHLGSESQAASFVQNSMHEINPDLFLHLYANIKNPYVLPKDVEVDSYDRGRYQTNDHMDWYIKPVAQSLLDSGDFEAQRAELEEIVNDQRFFDTNKYGSLLRQRLTNILRSAGYDALQYENDTEGKRELSSPYTYTDPERDNLTAYILWDPSKVKSGDLITYDENGNIIPLSERFDENKPEFRYSIRNPERDPGERLREDLLEQVRNGDADSIAEWVTSQLNKHEDQLENSKIRPPVIPSKGFVPPVSAEERAAQDRTNERAAKKYGLMRKSEKPVDNTRLAKRNEQGGWLRRFLQNVVTAKQTQTAQDYVKRFAFTDVHATYQVDSNERDLNKAKETISERGQDYAINKFVDDSAKALYPGQITETLALGQQLLIETSKEGNMAGFYDVLTSLALLSTQAGKSLQAFRMLKESGPIGELYYVKKAVDQLNDKHAKQLEAGKMSKITVNEELSNAVLTAATEEEREKAMDDLIADIAAQVPVTLAEKWNAWRYLAMLGNARTHIRNIFGNAIFVPLRFAKDLMAAGGEFIATKAGLMDEQDRTKAISVSRDLRDFAKQDALVMQRELQGSGKYNPARAILDARQVLPGFLEKVSRGNGDLLEFEDWLFLSPAYSNALAQALSHSGYSVEELQTSVEGQKALNRARTIALQEAQKATYRDFNAAASMLNRIKRMETGKASDKFIGLLLEGVLPFTKTPINILRRGVEYSPIGIASALFELGNQYKNGNVDVAEFIDRMSAGLSGTAVAVLGYLLASMGWLRGKKDDKEEEFDKLQGYQDYSLQIGDVSATIDWAAPTALPLFTGAAVHQLMQGDELEWSDAWDAMMMIAEPMMSLSMLEGLNSAISSASYADDSQKLATVASSALTSYLGQAFPTLLGQVARTVDGTRRTTYVDKNSKVPSAIQRFVQSSVQSKTPVWESQKVPYIDAWGREDTTGSKLLGGLENFFSPSYVNVVKTTDVDEKLQDLYSSTKEASVLPSTAAKYFSVGGQRKDLTADEYVAYAKDIGSTKYQLLTQLLFDPRYEKLSDADKAKAVKKIYEYATAAGKYHIDQNYDLHGQGVWMEEANAMTGAQQYNRIWEYIEEYLSK